MGIPDLYTAAEAAEKVRTLDDAIESLETFGTSYSIGDRTVTRSDLPALVNQRSRWMRTYVALYAKEHGARSPHAIAGTLRTPTL